MFLMVAVRKEGGWVRGGGGVWRDTRGTGAPATRGREVGGGEGCRVAKLSCLREGLPFHRGLREMEKGWVLSIQWICSSCKVRLHAVKVCAS